MIYSPLENLHQQFKKALDDDIYLGFKAGDKTLVAVKTKEIRLQNVFSRASEEIKNTVEKIEENENDHKGIEGTINNLKLLKEDAEMMFFRYEKHTKSWVRWFCKCLSRYTPGVLKYILPRCFSNQIEKAEKDTKREYEDFCEFLRKKVKSMESLKEMTPQAKKEEDVPKDESGSKKTIPSKKQTELADDKKKSPPRLSKVDEDDQEIIEDVDPELQRALVLSLSQDGDVPNISDTDKKEEKTPEETLVEPAEETLVEPDQTNRFEKVELTAEELTTQLQEKVTSTIDSIQNNIKLLEGHKTKPLSKRKYFQTLEEIHNGVIFLNKHAPEKKLTDELKLDEQSIKILSNKIKLSDNAAWIGLHFKGTPWIEDLIAFTKEEGSIILGSNRFGLTASNEKNERLQERDLVNYKGAIHITLSSLEKLDVMDKLLEFLNEHATCLPSSLTILVAVRKKDTVDETLTLTPKLVSKLLQLKDRIPNIILPGLKEINFKTLFQSTAAKDKAAVEEEKKAEASEKETATENELLSDRELEDFIHHLDSFDFPAVQTLTLPDHFGAMWTANTFNRLLKLFPSLELLEKCYHSCSKAKDVVVPQALTQEEELDLSGYAIEHINHLLSHIHENLQSLSLKGLEITDVELKHLIDAGYLAKVRHLDLSGCTKLSTDSLHSLTTLKGLNSLSLPNLPRGRLSLDTLPTFDDPLKIQMFYTSSKATHKIALTNYTGPSVWASAFEIPLARQGATTVFSEDHFVLDPKSVAYWLFKEDYKLLKPQTAIKMILADSNAGLTDENLTDFVKKFPNATILSLYNCPSVTNQGVAAMLKACPQVNVLDLTSCRQITEELLFDSDNLSSLTRIIVTDTGVASDVAQAVIDSKLLKTTVVCKDAVLKIDDDMLKDDAALESLLKSKDLQLIKRIDLSYCENLTDAMLGQLLDHLNTDMWIQTKEGLKDNPQRLNLAVLNLTGCPNITDEAFKIKEDGKDLKLLENLDRVIYSGTQLTEELIKAYPQVAFQEIDHPLSISIDPKKQLNECDEFLTKKSAIQKIDGDKRGSIEAEIKQAAKHMIHDRTVIGLFPESCDDEKAVQAILSQAIDFNDEEFADFTLAFSTKAEDAPKNFPVHRDVLYCLSVYFMNHFRPGGMLSKINSLNLVNQHATAEAGQLVVDTLYGKAEIAKVKWKTAAHAAELLGTKNFKTFHLDKPLLKRMREEFDMSNAEEMLLSAQMLNDKDSFKEFDDTLLAFLESCEVNDATFLKIANFARSYKEHLPKLFAKVDKQQNEETKRLMQKIQEEQDQEQQNLGAFDDDDYITQRRSLETIIAGLLSGIK